jgi:hypothetical protein
MGIAQETLQNLRDKLTRGFSMPSKVAPRMSCPLTSNELLRIARACFRSPATVRTVYEGRGSSLSREAVIDAAKRLGFPAPEQPTLAEMIKS